MSRKIVHDHVTLSTTSGTNLKNIIYPENTADDVSLEGNINMMIAEYGNRLMNIINKLGILAFYNSVIEDRELDGYKKVVETYPGSLEIVADDIADDLFNEETMIKIGTVIVAVSNPDNFSIGDYVVVDSYSEEFTWSASKIYQKLCDTLQEAKDYTLSKNELEKRLDELDAEVSNAIANEEINISNINETIINNTNEINKWKNRLFSNISFIYPSKNIIRYGNGDGDGDGQPDMDGSKRQMNRGWQIINDELKYTYIGSDISGYNTESCIKIIPSYISCSSSDERAIQIVSSTESGAPEDADGNPTIDNPVKIPEWFLEGSGLTELERTAGQYIRRYTALELQDLVTNNTVLFDEVRFNIHCGEISVDSYVVPFDFDPTCHIRMSEITDLTIDDVPFITTRWAKVGVDYYQSWDNPIGLNIHDLANHANVIMNDDKIILRHRKVGTAVSDNYIQPDDESTNLDLVIVDRNRTYIDKPIVTRKGDLPEGKEDQDDEWDKQDSALYNRGEKGKDVGFYKIVTDEHGISFLGPISGWEA